MRIATLVSLVSALAVGQELRWHQGSWKAALEEARQRNVPILLAHFEDQEEANERIFSGLYRDREFLVASHRAVFVLAAPVEHSKPARTPCARFPGITCHHHRDVVMATNHLYWEEGQVKTPSHIVVMPDATEVERLIDVLPTSAYVDALGRAQKKLGRALTRDEAREIQEQLRCFDEALRNDAFQEVAAARARLTGLVQQTQLEANLADGVTRLASRLENLLPELRQRVGGEDYLAVLRICRGGRRALGKSNVSTVESLLGIEREVQKSDRGRAAVSQVVAEEKSQEALAKAEELEKAGSLDRAIKSYLQLVQQEEGTTVASAALGRLEAIATSDPEGKFGKAVREGLASLAFKEARKLLDGDDPAAGRQALERLVSTWPKTRAAQAARRLLEPKR